MPMPLAAFFFTSCVGFEVGLALREIWIKKWLCDSWGGEKNRSFSEGFTWRVFFFGAMSVSSFLCSQYSRWFPEGVAIGDHFVFFSAVHSMFTQGETETETETGIVLHDCVFHCCFGQTYLRLWKWLPLAPVLDVFWELRRQHRVDEGRKRKGNGNISCKISFHFCFFHWVDLISVISASKIRISDRDFRS